VHLRRSNHAVTLWQVNLPCESLQKNFLTCDNYDSVIYGRALSLDKRWRCCGSSGVPAHGVGEIRGRRRLAG
jgi:hypothetical protein